MKKGYPDRCGSCSTGSLSKAEYNTPEEARLHVEQLEQMLAEAKLEEKRLKKEAELNNVPLGSLPFPSRKDSRFLKKLSLEIRIKTANGDKDGLFEIANIVDKMLGKE